MILLGRQLIKMFQHYLLIAIVWISYAFAFDYYTNEKPEENRNEPHYEFKYGVKDPDTGDVKNHWEIRQGDKVEGAYSFIEADGTTRIVQYSADKRKGFNAIVTKEHKTKPFTVLNHNRKAFEKFSPDLIENSHSKRQKNIAAAHSYFPLAVSRPDFSQPSSTLSSDHSHIYFQNKNTNKSKNFKKDSYWVPHNHSPVYKKLNDHAKLVGMYNLFRERHSKAKDQKFDYGINEYFANKLNRSRYNIQHPLTANLMSSR